LKKSRESKKEKMIEKEKKEKKGSGKNRGISEL
jgi:hypothetical protein